MTDPLNDRSESRTPTLQDLRADLAAAKWNDDLKPQSTVIPDPNLTLNQKKGFLGEDLMARTATARGEIILDYGSGIEDTNKRGADLVTLSERDGQLYVTMYDNKSLQSDTVRSVTALRQNFDQNLKALKDQWVEIVSTQADKRPPAEIALFKAAIACVDAVPSRLDRVVTNHNSNITRISGRLEADGIRFENMAGNPTQAEGASADAGMHMFRFDKVPKNSKPAPPADTGPASPGPRLTK